MTCSPPSIIFLSPCNRRSVGGDSCCSVSIECDIPIHCAVTPCFECTAGCFVKYGSGESGDIGPCRRAVFGRERVMNGFILVLPDRIFRRRKGASAILFNVADDTVWMLQTISATSDRQSTENLRETQFDHYGTLAVAPKTLAVDCGKRGVETLLRIRPGITTRRHCPHMGRIVVPHRDLSDIKSRLFEQD